MFNASEPVESTEHPIFDLIRAQVALWPAMLGDRPRRIVFDYYPYVSFSSRIWYRNRTLTIKLHQLLKDRPVKYRLAMIQILFDKLFGREESAEAREIYADCLRRLEADGRRDAVTQTPGGRRRQSVTRGEHRDLIESFNRVNHRMFNDRIAMPDITWSVKRARRYLGSYNRELDRLTISRILDSKNVPVYVLNYVMYHEMLHIKHAVRHRANGRRIIHPPLFAADERRFPDYNRAIAWIQRHI